MSIFYIYIFIYIYIKVLGIFFFQWKTQFCQNYKDIVGLSGQELVSPREKILAKVLSG